MATSNSYDWQATRSDIIKAALRKIGALGDWEDPTENQITVAAAAFQPLVKAWQAHGMPVWAIKEQGIACSFLADGSVEIGIGAEVNVAKPLKVFQAFLRRADKDMPVQVYDRTNFNSLTNKTITGIPNIIYYQPLVNTGILRCYPRPDADTQANGTMIIHYQAMYEDMDTQSDDLGFPSEWSKAVIYQLAVDLAPEYGLSINERQLLKAEAKEAKDDALSFGTEEGSLFLQPG